jgi:hypothetical protein
MVMNFGFGALLSKGVVVWKRSSGATVLILKCESISSAGVTVALPK